MAYDAGSQKGITEIMVRGFKSLYDESRIEVRPLTILAGANSSGKSSIMQPLLLLKQTLEAPYDPGPLLLDGPNVRFTQVEQLLSKMPTKVSTQELMIGLATNGDDHLTNTFEKQNKHGLVIIETLVRLNQEQFSFRQGLSSEEVGQILDRVQVMSAFTLKRRPSAPDWDWAVIRERCFLGLSLFKLFPLRDGSQERELDSRISLGYAFQDDIRGLIHVPGLRGNPERAYTQTANGPAFPGKFDYYVASIIKEWQDKKDQRLQGLIVSLQKLGLTSRVLVRAINDAQLELLVSRFHRNGRSVQDMVNIADVGFGVSQTLPVLVALLAAEPGQLVYLEQPEIHLHPRAQVALAEVLADAARRGVRVVAETHSSLLLLSIQTLVAEGKLDPELVKLHWFKRDEMTGVTKIASADLDERGAFGEWPEDFADIELSTNHNYLNASLFREVPR